MQTIIPLLPGNYYHIFNRGINGEILFKEEKNYTYFLSLYKKYINEFVSTLAFCLMNNHFHFLIKINNEIHNQNINASKKFSNLFNSYTQSINKAYDRTGSLFERPFKRKQVNLNKYLMNLIKYIHLNPKLHNVFYNYKNYPYSSFGLIVSNDFEIIDKAEINNLFYDLEFFEMFHDEGEADYDPGNLSELEQ